MDVRRFNPIAENIGRSRTNLSWVQTIPTMLVNFANELKDFKINIFSCFFSTRL